MADSRDRPWWNSSGQDGGTDGELQTFLLYSIMVASKPADQTRRKLGELLRHLDGHDTPFERLRIVIDSGGLAEILKEVRTGQYRRIEAAFRGGVTLDPRTDRKSVV